MKNKRTTRFPVSALHGFLVFLCWMAVFGLAVRLYEAALLGYYQKHFWNQLLPCLLGYGYDLVFFSKFALVLFPLYWLIHHFSAKAAHWAFRIIGALMLLVSNAMVLYYVSAELPLDKIFFNYSAKELIFISKSTGAFVWWGYVGLLLIPILFLVVAGKRKTERGRGAEESVKQNHIRFPLFLWLGLAIVGLFMWKVPSWAYRNRGEKYTICNKQEFFWNSLVRTSAPFSRFDAKDLEAQQQRILEFQSLFPENEFVDFRYPFAHIDHSPDVLSGYFDLDPDTMPNLVFIIVEGLSREFSGYNSQLPSATPFLDSLADHSLTWLNCMSSSQRTFAVLPSLFGSLPFGKRGFMLSSDSPRFRSLVDILKENGYSTSFFYGGWLCFDNMCYFLNDIGVDHYLPAYSSYPEDRRTTWGLYDEYLFSEALKEVENGDAPRLDIYLTLSTHDPFDYPDKERYVKQYTNLLVRKRQQKDIAPYLYEHYASFLYLDDCLRSFFAAYRHMPGYENTLFVVTGDHCFNAQSDELVKYHVPFIVWSPMLKEPHRFPALVAHRDMTPSMLAMLKHVYGIQSPSVVSWVNTGLDTASYFRANTFTPQVKSSREMDNMVYKDRFYDAGTVYQFRYEDDRLQITPVNDKKMVTLMGEYKALDDYVMNNDALLPLDEDKQFILRDIDSSQSLNYVILHAYSQLKDTLGFRNVFELNLPYPFNFYNEPLGDTVQSVIVYCDFDIYLPHVENDDKFTVSFAIDKADGSRQTIKSLLINHPWYDRFDQWDHFSLTQTVNKSQVHFVEGEGLRCYFTNGGEHSFYLKNFTLKVIGIHE